MGRAVKGADLTLVLLPGTLLPCMEGEGESDPGFSWEIGHQNSFIYSTNGY